MLRSSLPLTFLSSWELSDNMTNMTCTLVLNFPFSIKERLNLYKFDFNKLDLMKPVASCWKRDSMTFMQHDAESMRTSIHILKKYRTHPSHSGVEGNIDITGSTTGTLVTIKLMATYLQG